MRGYHIAYADWSGAEYAAALGCLLRGRVRSGENAARLAADFGARYAPSSVYLSNYGHAGIELALAAFSRRQPARREVLVPAYICPSVVQSVEAAGLKAVPVDIGHDLNPTPASIGAALSERALAVIAPHMFGCPARIDEIAALCRAAKVFLIDDAAQVVGIRQHGKLLGTFGDMGIVSFAQSKAVVTGIRGSGGVLLVNNRDFDAEIAAACRNLPAPPSRLGAYADFVWNYVWKSHTGNSGYLLHRLASRLGMREHTWGPAPAARISNMEAGIARIQLRRLARIQEDKIRVAALYQRELAAISASSRDAASIGFPQYAPDRYLARVMLLLPAGVDMSACRHFLSRRRIATRLGYAVPFARETATATAESLAGRLLGVPCGPEIGESEVREICRALHEAVRTASFNRG